MLKDIPLRDLIGPRTLLRPVLVNSVEYRELVDSIRKVGICQSLLVRPYKGKFEVVEGNHRYTAARELKLDKVPCIVKELTDEQAGILQVSLQAIRKDVKHCEYATRLQMLLDNGITLQELAIITGKSTSWLRDRLKLRRVVRDAREHIDNGDITLRAAIALSRLPISLQREYYKEAILLPAEKFIERARQVLKHYRETMRTDKLEEALVHMEVKPHLRNMSELREEAVTTRAAGVHLKLDGAVTALDGWKSCLKWLLHLDPISLEKHKHKVEAAKVERINSHDRRAKDRELRNQLLGDSHD